MQGSNPSAECPICTQFDASAIWRGSHWSIRPHPVPSPIAGWLIVDLMRHACSWDELSHDESSELGRTMTLATGAIRAATGCDRVYMLAFCEAVPHLHLHLAPRHDGDPRTISWCVADLYRAVQQRATEPADPASVQRAIDAIRERLDRRR